MEQVGEPGDEEQLAGTQVRGLENPLRTSTRNPMRPTLAARPRSSLSYTLALLKVWTSRPMRAGMLRMSRNAIARVGGDCMRLLADLFLIYILLLQETESLNCIKNARFDIPNQFVKDCLRMVLENIEKISKICAGVFIKVCKLFPFITWQLSRLTVRQTAGSVRDTE